MSAFGGLLFTNVGRNLQAKAQAGATLNFTRIAIGDGSLGGSSIADLTALKSQKKTMAVTKLKTMTGGKAVAGTSFSNSDITSGFYWRELGVFATDPDLGEILYCYGNAGDNAEYIPAGGGPDIVEKTIDCVIIVGNATNITASIDNSLVYVSVQDFNDGMAGKVSHSLATAANDFLVASGVGAFVKKTLAEVKSILGLGSAAYTASSAYATAAQGTTADGAIPKSLATAASQFLLSSAAGTWVIKTVAEIKTLLGLGSAAYLTSGSASGNVPVNGSALGTTANVPVVTTAAGALIPHASGVLGSAAFTASSGYATAAQGTTADGAIPKSLATAASQFLLSSAAGTWVIKTVAEIKTLLGLGSAAYLTSGSASGNVPVNGSALGTTANVPVVTTAAGALIPHASGVLGSAAFTASSGYATAAQGTTADGAIPKSLATAASQFLLSSAAGTWVIKTVAEIKTLLGLGSAAYLTSGSASGNVPVNGSALGTTANVPVVTTAAGALIPHASGVLGSAAFTASSGYATAAQGTLAENAVPKADYVRSSGYAVDAGVVNAYVIALSPAPTAYTDGMLINVKISNTNTSSIPTINVNSLGAKTILKANGNSLNAGELMSGAICLFVYNATDGKFHVVSNVPISNNLTETESGKALDATQGKALSDLVSSEATARSSADSAHAADLITDSDGAHGLKVESGTFTPAYGTTGVAPSSITYEGSTYGKYVKTGNVVHVQGKVQISAFTFGSGTGLLCLVGFPFAPSNAVAITVGDAENWSTNYPSSLIKMATNGTALFYCRPTANGPEGQMALANLSSAGSCIYFSGEYTV